ncbi:MAG: hypothetical protein QXD60_02480 [Nanopusillaceae archaeon]
MSLELCVDVGGSASVEATPPGGYASTVSSFSPTATLRTTLMCEMTGGCTGTVSRVTAAVLVDSTGVARQTIGIGAWSVSGSTMTSSVQFTALASFTLASVAYLAGGATYFLYGLGYTINSGWIYALRTTITAGISASGLTLSPVGSASLGTVFWHNYIIRKLAGTYTGSLRATWALWYASEYSTGQAEVILSGQLTGVSLSPTSGAVTHGFIAFAGAVQHGTYALSNVNLTLDQAGATIFVSIVLPSAYVLSNVDAGATSLTVNT